MTDKPRMGDIAPDDLFDPLDAAGFLLATADKDAFGFTIFSPTDVSEIQGWLDKARTKRGDARAADLAPAPDGSRVLVAEYVEEIPGPGGDPIFVKSIPTPPHPVEEIATAVNSRLAHVHNRLDRLERTIGTLSDQAGGRIATLEVQTEQHRRSIWQVASDLKDLQSTKALAKRLEEAEADHSRLQSRVALLEGRADGQLDRLHQQESRVAAVEATLAKHGQEMLSLEQRLYVDATGNRITRLENAVGELQRWKKDASKDIAP